MQAEVVSHNNKALDASFPTTSTDISVSMQAEVVSHNNQAVEAIFPTTSTDILMLNAKQIAGAKQKYCS